MSVYTLTPLTAGPQFTGPIATSSDGTVIAKVGDGYLIYVSTDSGVSWSTKPDATARAWTDITVSASGANIAACDKYASAWVSTDSGNTWTERPTPDGYGVRSVAYTRDGTKLYAATPVNIYQSIDDGANWTSILVTSGVMIGLSVSDDGNKVLALINNNSVYVGTYSGSWGWIQYLTGLGISSKANTSAISGDGTKMAFVDQSNILRYSTDSGLNWTQPTGAIASDTIEDVAISQDGTRFTAFSGTTVYTTTNPASTWTGQSESFISGYIAGSSTLGIIYITRSGGRYILGGELQGPPPIICFRDGSKILTFNPATGREEYTAVENIRPGTLVKTRMSGYVPVCMAGTSTVTIPNDAERTADRLYVCSKDQFPELTEDLYITGHHSILVNNMTDAEREECAEEMGRVYLTEGRCRLPAHISRRTRVYEAPGAVERIWHFALENNDEQMNYGVYANGLLVESCSIWRLHTMVGYELMSGNAYTLSNPVSTTPMSLPITC